MFKDYKYTNVHGFAVEGVAIAYDGCHKMYTLLDQADIDDATDVGYTIYPIESARELFDASCPLKFINEWRSLRTIIGQFEVEELIEDEDDYYYPEDFEEEDEDE